MNPDRRKLYAILSIALVIGYIWLFWELSENHSGHSRTADVCLIKSITSIPCPSCGSTRSVISLLKGDFLKSVSINPFGIIIALIMIITPLWISFDLLTGRKTLLDFYHRTEAFLRKPKVAIPLVFIVLMNWIWNITKGL